MTSSLSSKCTTQTRFEKNVFFWLDNCSISRFLVSVCVLVSCLLMEWSPVPHKSPWASLHVLHFCLLNVTLQVPCPRDREQAVHSFMSNPASKEMISDSVELWDTDVGFLHIQLMVTDTLPEFFFFFSTLQGCQQSLSLGINPIENAQLCCPHDNIIRIHFCDESVQSILPIVCRLRESIW